MNIGFFTEGGYQGKIPRNHPNMRTDLAWIHALDASHHPLISIHELQDNQYDLGIFILPKKKRYLLDYPLVDNMKRVCKKSAVMQECTFWYWQDDLIEEQVWYYNTLMEMDLIFCHNKVDLNYYKGITGKNCELMPTLMITDYVKPQTMNLEDRSGVMMGGNFVSIYRGFDDYIVSKEMGEEIFSISSGRMKKEETQMDINHLPWMNWLDWMSNLSRFKYGVHLGMAGAGTFNLNCSYLGIPCISYKTFETQRILHPELSVNEGDMYTARKLASKLKSDNDFYKDCSENAKLNFKEFYSEDVYKEKMKNIFKKYNIGEM